jgi:hypothetical protein
LSQCEKVPFFIGEFDDDQTRITVGMQGIVHTVLVYQRR